MLQDVGTQIVAHQVGIPGCAVEQALHPIGAAFSGVFGQVPAIFALDGTDNTFQIGQRPTTGFGASKTGGDAGMQAFEFLSPLPDLDKGRVRASRGERVGLLHGSPFPSGLFGVILLLKSLPHAAARGSEAFDFLCSTLSQERGASRYFEVKGEQMEEWQKERGRVRDPACSSVTRWSRIHTGWHAERARLGHRCWSGLSLALLGERKHPGSGAF